MSAYLLIGFGGVVGANARFFVSTWAAGRYGVAFPYGTFIINASGSVLLSFFLTIVADHFSNNADARFLVATGFFGAYTTFSTFAYETVALLRRGEALAAAINALGSAAVGVAGAGAGLFAARALDHLA